MQSFFHLLFVVVINITLMVAQKVDRNYEENIDFQVLNTDVCANGFNNKKLAIIVHGWLESCQKQWAQDLVNNLHIHRKGCVVCMDYSKYSLSEYFTMKLNHFEGIVTHLVKKINDYYVKELSFDPNSIYMFGFSFGAQIVLETGKRLSVKIKQIDVCEPTQVGFCFSKTEYRTAAQNVQCIHTSGLFGTAERDCHQDWLMGECGILQVAGSEFNLPSISGIGKGSHGLCPIFYNAAFDHKFPAIPKPSCCFSDRAVAPNEIGNVSMGYFDALKNEFWFPEGRSFFANTYKQFPYNVPVNENSEDDRVVT